MHISKRPIKRRGSMYIIVYSQNELEKVPFGEVPIKERMFFAPTSSILRNPLFDTEKYYYYFTEIWKDKYRPM
jgi:hypothetical protein